MEYITGLEIQCQATIVAARHMIRECLVEDALRSIVWSSAREGLWPTLADCTDLSELEFLQDDEEDTIDLASFFASHGDYVRADRVAATLQDESNQSDMQYRLALAAAERRDTAQMGAYMLTLDAENLMSVEVALTQAMIRDHDWPELDVRMIDQGINTKNLFYAAQEAVKQGELSVAVRYIYQAFAKEPDVYNDSLNRTLKDLAYKAYQNGQIGLIAELQSYPGWPARLTDTIIGSIEVGVVISAQASKDFEGAFDMFAAKAIDKGEDKDVYAQAQQAFERRDWNAVELLADGLNSEVLGVLHAAAYAEKVLDSAASLRRALESKPRYTGNYFVMADDAVPAMFNEALLGNWDEVVLLLPSTIRFFREEYTEKLLAIAAAQDRTDIMLGLSLNSTRLIGAAANELYRRGNFAAATQMFKLWEQQSDDDSIKPDIPYKARFLLMDHAKEAAALADWDEAHSALHQLNADTTAFDWHRGYEFVAIEALRILRAAQASPFAPLAPSS